MKVKDVLKFRACFDVYYYKNKKKSLRFNKLYFINYFKNNFNFIRVKPSKNLSYLLLSNFNSVVDYFSLNKEYEFLINMVNNSFFSSINISNIDNNIVLKSSELNNDSIIKNINNNILKKEKNNKDLLIRYLHGEELNLFYLSFLMIDLKNQFEENYIIILLFDHITAKIVKYYIFNKYKLKYFFLYKFILNVFNNKEYLNNYDLLSKILIEKTFINQDTKFINGNLNNFKIIKNYLCNHTNFLNIKNFSFKILIPPIKPNILEINYIYDKEFISELEKFTGFAFVMSEIDLNKNEIPSVIINLIKELTNIVVIDIEDIKERIENFNHKLVKKKIKLEKNKIIRDKMKEDLIKFKNNSI